ncbi:CBS domain-containing protein [Siphonobacter aquaeclarae]|jgi:CBS domain-containing protein|uniref:CBS domain-containing protein n=1 Tax=Siphonobacter aquaeclarae TaxID=563176 RepID=A0A1G9ULI1_9BACT|nr:CBS domain-containing protein [Siphonobacter aquaeclarae]MBO9641405.1 CBS domain-containing protein [Siphonobacter aquaeclarae]SDM60790.1 CBS domain-containing protein [Siphonobacter aquaeclarae]
MNKVSNLIYRKGNTVHTVDASASVYRALEMMVSKNVGALVVYHENEFVGILTERDYARKVILKGRHSDETAIAEIMDSRPATVSFDDSIEHCMALMSDKHIRYLPVLADGHVVGLVSMGDLVRFIIDDQKSTIQQLQNFISGSV